MSAQDALAKTKQQLLAYPQDVTSDLPRVRFPIRTKITLPFLLLAFSVAMGAAYLVTRVVLDVIDERFTNQLIEAGTLVSEWMVTEENSRLESLRLLSYTAGVAEALSQKEAELLRERAFGLVVGQQEDAVVFLDADGKLLLSMRHLPGQNLESYEYVKDGGDTFLQWDFAENIIQKKADGQGDKYSGIAHLDWGSYFFVSGPVYDPAGNFAGAILVGKSLSRLIQNVFDETLTRITLYDFDGLPVASSFLTPESLSPEQAATVIQQQDESSLRREGLVRREITNASTTYDEILGPWEIRGDIDLGIVGSSLPQNFLVKTSRLTRIQVTALVGTTLFLIVILGVVTARYITKPLKNLVTASEQVAQGNLQVKVDIKSNDEINVLANSFNRMVSNLYQSQNDLMQAYDATLEGWSKALELRDKETEGHTQRVTQLTLDLAILLGVDQENLVHLRRGALLHDIGKMGIPDGILNKPGPLDENEWQIMRKHPVFAYEMLWPIEYLRSSLDIPYCHHEKWDGSGYPRRLKRDEIPLGARIFAIIDVWDALTSDRPYRAAMSHEEAIAIICKGKGTHFDPEVVEAFLRLTNNSNCNDVLL